MLKKLAIAIVLFALPLGAMAQGKFGHMNSAQVITNMDEYKKLTSDLETMQKNYEDELNRTSEEFNKKYQELVQQQDSLPRNILERRQKEVQDMYERQQQFQQEAQQSLQKAQQDGLTPIMEKVNNAVQEIGNAGGYTYIFDIANGSAVIPFIGSQSTDVTQQVMDKVGAKQP